MLLFKMRFVVISALFFSFIVILITRVSCLISYVLINAR